MKYVFGSSSEPEVREHAAVALHLITALTGCPACGRYDDVGFGAAQEADKGTRQQVRHLGLLFAKTRDKASEKLAPGKKLLNTMTDPSHQLLCRSIGLQSTSATKAQLAPALSEDFLLLHDDERCVQMGWRGHLVDFGRGWG